MVGICLYPTVAGEPAKPDTRPLDAPQVEVAAAAFPGRHNVTRTLGQAGADVLVMITNGTGRSINGPLNREISRMLRARFTNQNQISTSPHTRGNQCIESLQWAATT